MRVAEAEEVGITAGWGETEVLMDVSSRRQALVQHRNLLARGLLSLVSFLRAFLLHVIKRNQVVVVLSSWSPALQSARPSSALALKQQQQRVRAAEGRLGDGRSRPRAASFVFRQGRNGSSASWVASYVV